MNFARQGEIHGLLMSRHCLVGVELYSESTSALIDSGTIPKVMSHKMVKQLRAPKSNRYP